MRLKLGIMTEVWVEIRNRSLGLGLGIETRVRVGNTDQGWAQEWRLWLGLRNRDLC